MTGSHLNIGHCIKSSALWGETRVWSWASEKHGQSSLIVGLCFPPRTEVQLTFSLGPVLGLPQRLGTWDSRDFFNTVFSGNSSAHSSSLEEELRIYSASQLEFTSWVRPLPGAPHKPLRWIKDPNATVYWIFSNLEHFKAWCTFMVSREPVLQLKLGRHHSASQAGCRCTLAGLHTAAVWGRWAQLPTAPRASNQVEKGTWRGDQQGQGPAGGQTSLRLAFSSLGLTLDVKWSHLGNFGGVEMLALASVSLIHFYFHF